MNANICEQLKDALVRFVRDGIDIRIADGECLITLPVRTLDDRMVSVYVAERGGNYCVHDGAKSTNELFSQGLHLSADQVAQLKEVARLYGAKFDNDKFEIHCPSPAPSDVAQAIVSMASCAIVAMVPLSSPSNGPTSLR